MSEMVHSHSHGNGLWNRIDKAWALLVLILLLLAVFDPANMGPMVHFALVALLNTAPFILFAILSVAYLKATGAETLLARAFKGNPVRMIFLAALIGGLAPFCSCEVIPFIAAMLALGAPLGAVMAFWLAAPLMDPAMFLITAGTLGWGFAVAKAIGAVTIGLLGGFVTRMATGSAIFAAPLRENGQAGSGGCCSPRKPFEGQPLWTFWHKAERVQAFRETMVENGLFLLKWLALAYLVEAVMLEYIPADAVAGLLGGAGFWPILLAALVGVPAYLNGYAAVPMVDALLAQGMSNGAAMSFIIAGGVSCIPAAIAVWALVKPRVFFAYIAYALIGAILAGLIWQGVATI